MHDPQTHPHTPYQAPQPAQQPSTQRAGTSAAHDVQTRLGWDRSGLVAVGLDRYGAPVLVHVVDGWDRHATADDLAGAILGAARSAASALDEEARSALASRGPLTPTPPVDAVTAPSAVHGSYGATASFGVDPRVGAGAAYAADGAGAAGPHAVPVVPATSTASSDAPDVPGAVDLPDEVRARPLTELAELAIAALAAGPDAASGAQLEATIGTATALDDEVVVQVARGGIVGVTLRGPRVARASGRELSALLTQTVRGAVADLDRRLAALAPAVSDELLAEVLAHLRALSNVPGHATHGPSSRPDHVTVGTGRHL